LTFPNNASILTGNTHVSETPPVNSQSCRREKGSLASGTAAVQMATMSGTQEGCSHTPTRFSTYRMTNRASHTSV
jgi:hypothetical protein